MVFGIAPRGPETGFGYIRSGSSLGKGAHVVEEFVEKPDLATAQTYVDSGRYTWNSGMFLFTARTFLETLKVHFL